MSSEQVTRGEAIEALRGLRAVAAGEPMPVIAPAAVPGVLRSLATTALDMVAAALGAFGESPDGARAETLRYLDSHLAALMLGEVSEVPQIRFRVTREGQ